MAILFPLILRYKKDDGSFRGWPLLVNPTDIDVNKRAQISETRTLAGTIFQPWPNMPDEVRFKGLLYGTRSVVDFPILQMIIDGKPEKKEVEIIYKWKKYHGYIKNLGITSTAGKPRQFSYSFDFTSKEPFSLPRMMLGQITGYKAEEDYLKAQLYGLKTAGTINQATAFLAAGSMFSGLAFGNVIDPTTYTEVDKTLNSDNEMLPSSSI